METIKKINDEELEISSNVSMIMRKADLLREKERIDKLLEYFK